MFPRAIRLGSVGGVDVRVDPSWLIIAALVGLSFWAQFRAAYGHGPAPAAAMALIAAGLFFASVLFHELAHALEALHRGVHVAGITLFLFGGVTETGFDVRRPKDEFALSAVGPYASFVAAATFGLVAGGAQVLRIGPVAQVAGLLAWLNLALAAFNLLPGAPLDGGRILRALLWRLTGDRAWAIRGAARVGQVLGGLLLGGGLLVLWTRVDVANGIWLAFIGWFLFQAASGEHAHAETQTLVAGHTVASVTRAPHTLLPADATVAQVLDDVARDPADVHAVGHGDEVVGVVRVDDLAGVGHGRRPFVRLSDVMRPLRAVVTVRPDIEIVEAVERIRPEGVLVVRDDSGRIVGLLTARELDRAVDRLRRLSGQRSRRGRDHLPSDAP